MWQGNKKRQKWANRQKPHSYENALYQAKKPLDENDTVKKIGSWFSRKMIETCRYPDPPTKLTEI